MTDDPNHDDDIDAMLDELEEAGVVERFTNAAGEESMRLTKTGRQIANQLSSMDEAGRDEFIETLRGAEDTGEA